MKVLVISNKKKDVDYTIAKEVVAHLSSINVDVFVEVDAAFELGCSNTIDENNVLYIDFAVVIGGDGTILSRAKKYKAYDMPVLGINMGRVGCLAEATPENWKDAVEKIIKGEYKVEKRVSISGALEKASGEKSDIFAFNDVVIQRALSLKMLDIHIKINDTNDTAFFADGVIVATPTGSSAYSLSSGGPLIYPSADAFVITPICAQLKTITSLVVSSNDRIEISVGQHKLRDINPRLEIDGAEILEIEPGDVLKLEKGAKTLNIIKVNLNSSLYEPIFKVTNTFGR